MPLAITPSGDAGLGQLKLFVAIALLGTWAVQLPALLAKYGVIPGPVERFVPLAALGGFMPVIAATLAARREPGGTRELWARFAIRGVAGHWYLIALALFPALYFTAAALYAAVGGQGAALVYPPENAQQVAAMLLIPLTEEPAWRGYALPRLQRRYGAIKACCSVGVIWALWHVVMFLLQGANGIAFAIAIADILVGSFAFSWLYNRTRGSLVIAVLAHLGAHLSNPAHALPDPTPLALQTGALLLAAVALLALDRAAWQRREA